MKHLGKKRGITCRQCSGCGGDLGDRYKKQRYCKSCHAKHMREHRPKHSEMPPLAKKKANARSYANVYLYRGALIKENCKMCGSKKVQMHHEDYNKPLQVTWLCRQCHLKHHQNENSSNLLSLGRLGHP